MKRIRRFKQTSLHSRKRRIGAWLRRRLLHRFVPSPEVYVVELGRQRYKRVVFPDSWMAERKAAHLARFERFGVFPGLVTRFENELLVEFIEGRVLNSFDAPLMAPLARFFGTLYGVGARRVNVEESGHALALQRDLDLLRSVEVIDTAVHDELLSVAARIAPSHVWIGYEYVDSLPKNFVMTSGGRLIAVDVAAIHSDQLLGIGVAKALLRSPDSHRELLLREMKEHSSLDLSESLAFVDLCFLAAWTRNLYLKGRSRLIDPSRFDPVRFKTR